MLKNWSFVVRLGLACTNANLDELFCRHEPYRTTEERDMAGAVDLSNSNENPLLEKWAKHPSHGGRSSSGSNHRSTGEHVDRDLTLEKELETAFVFRLSFDGRNDDVPIVKQVMRVKVKAAEEVLKWLYTTKRNAASFVYTIAATSVMELFESFRQRYVTCQILVKHVDRAETEVVASASLTLLELLLATEPSFSFRLNTRECVAEQSSVTGSGSHHTSLNCTTVDSFLGSDDVLLVQKEKREGQPEGLVLVRLRMDESATIEMTLKELVVENLEVGHNRSAHGGGDGHSSSEQSGEEFCVQYGPGWVVRSLSANERNQLRLSPASNTAASSPNGSSCAGFSSSSHFTYNTTSATGSQAAHHALATPWTRYRPSANEEEEDASALPLLLDNVGPVSITSTLDRFTDKFTFGFLLLARSAPAPLRSGSLDAGEKEEERLRQTSEMRCEESEVSYFELPFHALRNSMDRINATFSMPFSLQERKVEMSVRTDASGLSPSEPREGSRCGSKRLTLRGTVVLGHLPIFKIVAADLLDQEMLLREYKLSCARGVPKAPSLPRGATNSPHQESNTQENALSWKPSDAESLSNPLLLKTSAPAQATNPEARAGEGETRAHVGRNNPVAHALFTDEGNGTGLPHSHSEEEEEPSASGQLPQSTVSSRQSVTESTPLRTIDHTHSGPPETVETTETLRASSPLFESSPDISPERQRQEEAAIPHTDYTPTRMQRVSATSSMPTPPALPTPPKRKEEEGGEEEEEEEDGLLLPNQSTDRLLYTDQSAPSSTAVPERGVSGHNKDDALFPHQGEGLVEKDAAPVTRRIIDSSSSTTSEDDSVEGGKKEKERRTSEDSSVIHRNALASEEEEERTDVDSDDQNDTADDYNEDDELHETNHVTVRPASPTSTSASVPVDSPSVLTLDGAGEANGTSGHPRHRQNVSSNHTECSSVHATADPVLVAELHQVLDTMVTELSSSPKNRGNGTTTTTTTTTTTADGSDVVARRSVNHSQNQSRGGEATASAESIHAEALLAAFAKLELQKAALLNEMERMHVGQRASSSAPQNRSANGKHPIAHGTATRPSPPNTSNHTPNVAREAQLLASTVNISGNTSATRRRETPNTSKVVRPAPPPPPSAPDQQSTPGTHYKRQAVETDGLVNSPFSLSTTGPSSSTSPLPRRQAGDTSEVSEPPRPACSSRTPSRPSTAESYFRRSYLFRQNFSSSAARPAPPEASDLHVVTQRPPSAPLSGTSLRLGGGEDAPTGASGTDHPYWVQDAWTKEAAEAAKPPMDDYYMPPVKPTSRPREDVHSAWYSSTTRDTNVTLASTTAAPVTANCNSCTSTARASAHTFDINIINDDERETAVSGRTVLRPIPMSSSAGLHNPLYAGGTLHTAEEELFIGAIEKCDVQLVQYLLRCKPHLVQGNDNLLHIACAVKVPHALIVEMLLQVRPELARGVDTNTGCTALHCACDAVYHDHLDSEVIKVLLLRGVKAGARSKTGLTAFHTAVLFPFQSDHSRALQPPKPPRNKEAVLAELFQVLDHLLVVGGSDVNERTRNGETALHLLCAQRKNVEDMPVMLAYLCSRGADVYATATYMMQDGQHVRHLVPIEVSQLCGEQTTTMILADYMQQQQQQQH